MNINEAEFRLAYGLAARGGNYAAVHVATTVWEIDWTLPIAYSKES